MRHQPRFGQVLAFLSSAVLLVATAAPSSAQQKPAVSQDPLVRMNEAIDALTRKVWPSVVQILVSSYGAREEALPGRANAVVGRQRSSGSGFVVDPDGYIMTNAHVVSGARRVQIVLPAENADGTLATALSGKTYLLTARIVGITTELDLALLKVDGQKLPALPLATYSQLRQGETVFAFGSPIGMRNTLTHGLVSAVARQVDPDSPQIFVQTDAPINPGNSGGPLVNIRGEVVGVNTFIVSQSGGNEGLGFAIPSATVRTVFRQLKQFGQLRRQEIGMSIQTITSGMAASLGLVEELRRDRVRRLARRPGRGGGPDGRRHPGVGGWSARRQPADGELQLPSQGFAGPGAAGRAQRSGRTASLSVAPVEERSDFDSLSERRIPQKNLVAELGILGVEIDHASPPRRGASGSVRRHRDRPSGRRGERSAAPAEGRHPQLQQPARSRRCRASGTRSRALKPGAPVTLQIQREGRLMYVSFTFD